MSTKASGYAKVGGDKFYTPAWVTKALLSVETFDGGIWDPAAGDGQIIMALPAGAYGSDIAPDVDWVKAVDFFDVRAGNTWPNIITNPPYGEQSRLAVRFIEHALQLTKPLGGKVAMLLKVGFDSAGSRRHLFGDHPAFAAEHRLTRRIRWTNFEQKKAGPTENHSWFCWDWRARPGTTPIKSYLPKETADA